MKDEEKEKRVESSRGQETCSDDNGLERDPSGRTLPEQGVKQNGTKNRRFSLEIT